MNKLREQEDISPSTHNMDVPNVSRNEYQLVSHFLSILHHSDSLLQVNIDDGFLNLMTQDGTPKDDVKVPDSDLGKDIQAQFDDGKDLLVTIISAMGEEQVCLFYLLGGRELHTNAFNLLTGHLFQGGSQGLLICESCCNSIW